MELKNNTLLRNGTYRILKKLGQGSFGITYLAEHTALGKKVAIKEFFMKDINYRSDDGSITGITDGSFSYNYGQKFKREALNLAKLEHPNIVRVTDCFDENSTYYYVMDFIEGDNLNDYLNSHTVSENEAIAIIKDVTSALTYMHDQHHMLHLDLKPGNIMRRASDGHIFLIDFGLSKNYNSDGQPETSTNIGLGTAGYAPIEQGNQARGGEFRPTIDVYALGATLYKLLTGETPPAASDVLADKEQLSNKLNKKGISQSVTNLVMEAMEPIAKDRIPTVSEFSRRLTEINTTSPSVDPAVPDPPVAPAPTPRSRHKEPSDYNLNSENARIADQYTEDTEVADNHQQVEDNNIEISGPEGSNNKGKKKRLLRIAVIVIGFLGVAGLVSGVIYYLIEHNKQVQFEQYINSFNDKCPINTNEILLGVLTSVDAPYDAKYVDLIFDGNYTLNKGGFLSTTEVTNQKLLWKRHFLGNMNQSTIDFINFVITSERDIYLKPKTGNTKVGITNYELKEMLKEITSLNNQINARIKGWKLTLPQSINEETTWTDIRLDGNTLAIVWQINENSFMLNWNDKEYMREILVKRLQVLCASDSQFSSFLNMMFNTGKSLKYRWLGTKSRKMIDIDIDNFFLVGIMNQFYYNNNNGNFKVFDRLKPLPV